MVKWFYDSTGSWNNKKIKILFHKYDEITSERQYITSILLVYSLDKHSV